MRQRVPGRLQNFARQLRTDQTDPEWQLWACLRAGRLDGLKFKRQVPIDGYIVEFVCLAARLIVELDGGQHAGSTRDQLRDHHFLSTGFATLRFWNSDVMADPDEVAYQIGLVAKRRIAERNAMKRRQQTPSPQFR